MSPLSIYLLGPPRLERDGAALHMTRRRALALLVYLAVTGTPHQREQLATLIWPEARADRARGNLRRMLHDVNRTVGDGQLLTDNQTVCLPRSPARYLDIDAFRAAVASCRDHGHGEDEVCPACLPPLADAVELYQDDFLAGFTLPDSPAFDDWQFYQAEAVRAELATVLDRLVRGHVAQDQPDQAIAYARRRLALDPLEESVHRRLMQLYAWSGRQAAALRQYEQCRQLLADELGLPPARETEQLYATVKARRPAPPFAQDAAPPAASIPPTLTPGTSPQLDDIRVVTALSVGLTAPPDASAEPPLDLLAQTMDHLLALVTEACAPVGGQLERVAGEDLLVLFGVDHVHEDDAERAVRAASAILAAAKTARISVHIGIDTGMAYCRHQQTGTRAVLGAVVSMATRLRTRAAAGHALLGRTTYLATRGLCDTTPLQLNMPGAHDAVPAYALLRLRPRATKRRGVEGLHAELIGRDREMALLEAGLGRALAGHGQMIALVGEAGVGKSRLVEELRQRAAHIHPTQPMRDPSSATEATPLWLEGRCLQHAMNSPYWLFVDLFQELLRLSARDGAGGPAQAAVTLLRTLEDARTLMPEEVDEIGPLLGWLLALRFESEWDQRLQPIDADQIRRRLLVAIPRLLTALATRQPLVLVLEDLHWVDPASLALVDDLVTALAPTPTLLLCVYRPEEVMGAARKLGGDPSSAAADVTEIRVAPLTHADSRRLVASLLSIDQLPAAIRDDLLTRAQGNPFFLEELIRALIDRGVLYRAGNTWTGCSPDTPLAVPATVQSVILNRVEQLPISARQLLQAASVFGRLFRPRLLRAMDLTAADLTPVLADLAREDFIYAERGDPAHGEEDVEYSFHHVLVQDAIYQDLPHERRLLLHRRAGGALERVYADDLAPHIAVLAYHFDRSDAADKAVSYLLQAGLRAEETYLKAEAVDSFERVLARLQALPPSPRRERARLTALHGLGRVQQSLDNLGEAERLLRSAVDLAAALELPASERTQIMLTLAELLDDMGDHAAQDVVAQEGVALPADAPPSMEAVVFRTMLAYNTAMRGEWHRGMAALAPTIPYLPTLPHSPKLTYVYQSMVMWCRYAKQVDWGFQFIEEAATEAMARRDYWTAGHIRAVPMLFLYEAVGDSAALTVTLDAAERLAAQTGDEVLRLTVLYWQAINFGWLHGQLEAAATRIHQVLTTRSDTHRASSHILAHNVLGLVHFCRHEWEKAAAVLGETSRLAAASGIVVDGVRRGRVGLAWTYLQLGRPRDGLDLLARIALEEELHIESWPTVACALAGLEPMCANAAEFAALRDRIIAARTEEPLPLVQWSLTPAAPDPEFTNDSGVALPAPDDDVAQSGWTWHDQFGDCALAVEESGLVICAANYHDLWLNNFAAPRLLRAVRGDLAVQARFSAAYPDRPPLGGLLLWADQENYLQLVWNTLAPGSLALVGCRQNVDGLFAMGHLPDVSEIHLRLERRGDRVRALCRADAERWCLVGEVEFKSARSNDELDVGLVGIGMIHRYVHAGTFQQGAAIRVTEFGVWNTAGGASAGQTH